jgi:NAD(P)-dependent dehydrogenase (short-subunit alcohol dehydrogenase family)
MLIIFLQLKALALTGATIYGCARDHERAMRAIGTDLISSGQVKLLHLEMTDLESVRRCAADFRKSSSVLNVIVNNAAV